MRQPGRANRSIVRAVVAGVTIAVASLATSTGEADGPPLSLPVRCTIGETCFVQTYVDHDPGPGRLDFQCGRLSYDGHDGTDIRLADLVAMRRGVAVVAAAAGVVRRTRDGMADVSVDEIGSPALAGRLAGNGVVIAHGNGWETQYSHLRRGSVRVRPTDRVAAGDELGLIGLSGNTVYPHVEFTVRRDGRAVDPFVGPILGYLCGDRRQPLWHPDAERRLAYRASGILSAGFAMGRPDAKEARNGDYAVSALPADMPALVFWIDMFGAMAGDLEQFTLTMADGRVLHHGQTSLKASNVSWFSYSGRRRPAGGWPPGPVTGTYRLIRAGETLLSAEQTAKIRPAAVR